MASTQAFAHIHAHHHGQVRGADLSPSSRMFEGRFGRLFRTLPAAEFARAAAMGIALSLAGHTHGGQIRFALGNRQWSPASLLTPFVAGMYRLPLGLAAPPSSAEPGACPQAYAFLYVNPGLGTFALPMRLGVPPEITVLTLRAAE